MQKSLQFIITSVFIIVSVLGFSQDREVLDQEKIREYSQRQNNDKFRFNAGQWNSEIRYQTSSAGAFVRFLDDEISYAFVRKVESADEELQITGSGEVMVYNVSLINAEAIIPAGRGKYDSHANYLKGNDRSKHVKNVPDYDKIEYNNIYDGVTMKWYHSGTDLKYDFILEPGADIRNIKLKYSGVEKLWINRKGELEVTTPWGSIFEKSPFSYQLEDGVKKEVDVRYNLKGENVVSFEITGEYDTSKELIIDPVVLEWGTYIGGSTNVADGYILNIDMDKDGNVYCTGFYDEELPVTPGVYSSVVAGNRDVFVCKLSADGAGMDFATYIGGRQAGIINGKPYELTYWEEGERIKVGNNGEIYVFGITNTVDFPTTSGAFDEMLNKNGTNNPTNKNNRDAFLLQLLPDGSDLVFSTFLGGDDHDHDSGFFGFGGLDLDDSGNAYVSGFTKSVDFPKTLGTRSASEDVFVTKFDPSGKLVYSNLFGGSSSDKAGNLVVDKSTGKVFVTGSTMSQDFPIKGAGSKQNVGVRNAFLVMLDANGVVTYSSCIGGSSLDDGYGIDINAKNEVFITGTTTSKDFPVTTGTYMGPGQGFKGGAVYDRSEAFVVKTNTSGAIAWGTFLGGGNNDEAKTIKVSDDGLVFVAGKTATGGGGNYNTYPVTACGFDRSYGGNGMPDGFLSVLNPTGSSLLYSTFVGGTREDYKIPTVVLRGDGCVTEVAYSITSHSTDFLTTSGSFMPDKGNGTNDQPTVIKLKPTVSVDFGFTTPQCNTPIQFTDKSNSFCIWGKPWKPTEWYWDFGDGSTSTEKDPKHTYLSGGAYQVKLVVNCPADSIVKTITIAGGTFNGNLSATSTDSDCGQSNGTASVTVSTQGSYIYRWDDPGHQTASTATGLAPGTYNVVVSDPATCSSKTIPVTVGSQPDGINVTISSTPSGCGKSNGEASVAVTGGSGNYTYLWDDPNAQTTASVSGLTAGTYKVVVGDKNGCPPDTTLTVKVEAQGALVLDAKGENIACGGSGIATVNVTGGDGNYFYLWDDVAGQTTATATGLAPGIYNVKVLDGAGCEGDAQVEITTGSTLTINVPPTQVKGCDRMGAVNGEAYAVVTGGTPPYTYLWSDSLHQTNDTATGLPIGVYTVTATDSNGCTIKGTAAIEEVIQIDITVDVDPCPSGCSNGEVTANVSGTGSPPYTYRWDDSGQQTTPTATGLGTGTYTVTVTDDQGCRNTATVAIGGITGFGEVFVNPLKVYPNPSNGLFSIELKNKRSSELIVNDIRGREVFRNVYQKQVINLDLSELTEGVYLMKVVTEEDIYYHRLYLK